MGIKMADDVFMAILANTRKETFMFEIKLIDYA
jgi:hypothetical protein